MINYSEHEKYMQRCLDLAKNGFGNTAPNPMVGSVIVYDGKIIGEGFHRKSGEPHAEVNAVNSVKDKSLLNKSTIYVSLEPCSHYGKTPPCANLIASLGIPNVVVGTKDTASHVSGKGIKILKDAGCAVTVGVLEKECREINKRFFTFHEKNRPYIILKWAQTKDGFIDVIREDNSPIQPTWITNELAKSLVHKWRSEEQAILVGTNTARLDNPSLTTRNWAGKNPLRVVLDKTLELDPNLNLFDTSAETLIIADKEYRYNAQTPKNKNVGIEFVNYKKGFSDQFFKILVTRNIQSMIVEGGEKVLNYFIQKKYWDEALIFTGNKEFGQGVKAPEIKLNIKKTERLGDSYLSFIKK